MEELGLNRCQLNQRPYIKASMAPKNLAENTIYVAPSATCSCMTAQWSAVLSVTRSEGHYSILCWLLPHQRESNLHELKLGRWMVQSLWIVEQIVICWQSIIVRVIVLMSFALSRQCMLWLKFIQPHLVMEILHSVDSVPAWWWYLLRLVMNVGCWLSLLWCLFCKSLQSARGVCFRQHLRGT